MAAPKPKNTKKPLAGAVDEIGLLERTLAPFKPKFARLEALRKLIRASAADANPEDESKIEGLKFHAFLGARTIERTVNVLKLSQLLSSRGLMAVVSCTLAALEREGINPAIVAQVVEATQTGTRPLVVIPKSGA
jgi:hypothetical protein